MKRYESRMTTNQSHLSFPQFVWIWNRSQGQATPTLHLTIAKWLGQRWEIGDRRLLLLCFRSAGKSTLIGMFCVWLLLNQPNLRILILSAECDLAKKMVRNVKNIIERHPLTSVLIPEKVHQWASDQFTVRRSMTLRDPSLLARGISSNITGSRADIIISDDVEVPNTCRTTIKREDLRGRLHEINYVLAPGGVQLFAGTPHSLHSIYSDQPSDEDEQAFLSGFTKLTIPLLNEQNESQWPERFPSSKINELREQTGPIKFQSQMMLEPIADNDLRLDPNRLLSYEDEIQHRHGNNRSTLTIAGRHIISATAWWDPSFGSPRGGDASVVAAVFVDEEGEYWLHSIRYLEHDPSKRSEVDEATQLCHLVVDFVASLCLPSITVETNGLGRFLPSILQREVNKAGLSCSVLEHNSHSNKDQRILSAFDPVIAAGALHVHTSVWQTPFINEMHQWRPGRNGRDDGLDAVSSCILAQPVRTRKASMRKWGRWHSQEVTQALETDFVP